MEKREQLSRLVTRIRLPRWFMGRSTSYAQGESSSRRDAVHTGRLTWLCAELPRASRRQIFSPGRYVSVFVARSSISIGRHAGQRVVTSHVHFRDWRVCRANVRARSNYCYSNPLGQTLYLTRQRNQRAKCHRSGNSAIWPSKRGPAISCTRP